MIFLTCTLSFYGYINDNVSVTIRNLKQTKSWKKGKKKAERKKLMKIKIF